MPQTPSKSRNFIQFLLIFLLVYVGSQFVLERLFPSRFGDQSAPKAAVELTVPYVKGGPHPILTLKNHTAVPLTLPDRCPLPPVDVFRVGGEGVSSGSVVPLTPALGTENAVPCEPVPAIDPGGSEQISLAPWKYSLFSEYGTYEVRLTLPAEIVQALRAAQTGATVTDTLTARFGHGEPGAFTKAFRTFITKPFLNFLIFAGSWLPGHNLGLAIIILTLLVKILLFFPTQHALEGQKKMQMLQPKLDELKKKHGSDPQRMQEETLKLWKEYKVNPFQSCLPTLIQFPILIGLFYVIRDGSVLGLSRHLIYPFYQDLGWQFGTMFLGLDLLNPSWFIMPPLLVFLQFMQMKLTFAIAARKKRNAAGKDAEKKIIDVGEKKKEPLSATDMQQKVFLYVFPIMIGAFAFQFPAAVSLYWGVSTLFAIGQQILVNREHLRV